MRGIRLPYILALTVILLVALLFERGVFAQTQAFSEAAQIGQGAPSFSELEGRFGELAKEKGALYAFEILRRAPLPPNTDLHLLGHSVGDELYQEKGVSAIGDCTQEFRNACSHSIVIGALNEFGPSDSTIATIRDACTSAPGGSGAYTMCFHGLGHGIFAYFGYDLVKAVAFCARFGTAEHNEEEYAQCVGGIAMELVGGGGHDRDMWLLAHEKYLTEDDPLAPCNTTLIPDEAKHFCVMYLTPHLFELAGVDLGAPDPRFFPAAFRLCDAWEDRSLRDACYGSFGKEFIPLAGARDIRAVDRFSDEEYERAIAWCVLGGSAAAGPCIGQELASVFWGGENDPESSLRFCSLVTDTSLRSNCYRELAQNIARYLSGAARTELCPRLPAAHQEICSAV